MKKIFWISVLSFAVAVHLPSRPNPAGSLARSRSEGVASAQWPVFAGDNPLDPLQLNQWIRANRLDGYFRLPEYPAAVAALVVHSAGRGDPFSGLPTQINPGLLRR